MTEHSFRFSSVRGCSQKTFFIFLSILFFKPPKFLFKVEILYTPLNRCKSFPHMRFCHYPSHETSMRTDPLLHFKQSLKVDGFFMSEDVLNFHVFTLWITTEDNFPSTEKVKHDGRFASASQDFPLAKWHFK